MYVSFPDFSKKKKPTKIQQKNVRWPKMQEHQYLLFSATYMYIVVFEIVSHKVWKLFICIIIGKLIYRGNVGVFLCMAFVLVIEEESGKMSIKSLLFVVLVFRINFSADIVISCQS